MTNIYDEQLKHILDRIVNDYQITLTNPDWHRLLLHEKVHTLLVDHHLLVVVTMPSDDDVAAAHSECHANVTALYDYLVMNLFSRVANRSLASHRYEAEGFLVLVFSGPAGNVIEVIGQQVIPFVREYHQQPLPDPALNQQIAIDILDALYVENQSSALLQGITDCIDRLRIQELQPVPLVNMDDTLPEPLPMDMPDQAVPDNDQSSASTQPEYQPAVPADEAASPIDLVLLRRDQPRRRTAPLPDYFSNGNSKS